MNLMYLSRLLGAIFSFNDINDIKLTLKRPGQHWIKEILRIYFKNLKFLNQLNRKLSTKTCAVSIIHIKIDTDKPS